MINGISHQHVLSYNSAKTKPHIEKSLNASEYASGISTIFSLYAALFFNNYYACEMHCTGHTPAHDPQSMQVFASIMRCASASEIAETGHSGSQLPQLIHASLIT